MAGQTGRGVGDLDLPVARLAQVRMVFIELAAGATERRKGGVDTGTGDF
jgi:hypothetical protein